MGFSTFPFSDVISLKQYFNEITGTYFSGQTIPFELNKYICSLGWRFVLINVADKIIVLSVVKIYTISDR